MKKISWILGAFLVLGSLAASAAEVDEGSVVRGGRLYDDWMKETRERAPAGVHPALTGKASGVSAYDSWRCAQCHGFDYKGQQGIVGIRGKRSASPAAIVGILKSPGHHYEVLLKDSDLADLANFVAYGQADLAAATEKAARTKAALETSERRFATICANCHGTTGSRLRDISPLGVLARQKGAEVLHVLMNGHPGGEMPALGAFGEAAAGQMMLFLQSLPGENLAASIAHGGRLYDDWQTEQGSKKQSLPHPSYPKTGAYAADPDLTWRCKECHGWDYRGNQGEYAAGPHATGIKGVTGMRGADVQSIVSVLRNPVHQYGAVLKQRDLEDLASFISLGQVDMDTFVDRRTRSVRGDAKAGAPFYRTLCAGCHGNDGKRITTPLARVVKANPWGSLHTVLNGHPDEKMPALRELDAKLVADILAYIQTQ